VYVIPNNLMGYSLDCLATAPIKPKIKIKGTVTPSNAKTTKKLL